MFVFALTQVASLLAGDLSAAGFGRATLVLALVWWAWSGYAWMTNAVDLEPPEARAAFLLAMAASFVLALGVPEAYHRAPWFAVPYLVVSVLQVALYVYGLRAQRSHQRAILQLAPYFLVAPVLVLAGAFVDDPWRTALWLLSLVVAVGGTLTVGDAGFRVSAAHFAERYALFVIIALGESVVASGVGLGEAHRDARFLLAVGVAIAFVGALWWAYFDFTSTALERTLARRPVEERGPHARDVFTLFHFPIVLGIIYVAVAGKHTLEHSRDPLELGDRVALGGGIAIFLIGFCLARYRVVRRVAWERLVGAPLAVAVCLAGGELSSLALVAITFAVLAAILVLEAVRLRDVRAWAHRTAM